MWIITEINADHRRFQWGSLHIYIPHESMSITTGNNGIAIAKIWITTGTNADPHWDQQNYHCDQWGSLQESMGFNKGINWDFHRDQWGSQLESMKITTGINGDHHSNQWGSPQEPMGNPTGINKITTAINGNQQWDQSNHHWDQWDHHRNQWESP
jgi:hypothetical protein